MKSRDVFRLRPKQTMNRASSSLRPGLCAVLWLFVACGHGGARAAEVARSSKGMVVAGSAEACEIGVAILALGGSAMDAAVGVSLALGVGEPYGSGIGGKIVLLHRSGSTGEIVAVSGLDAAPSGATAAELRAIEPGKRIRGWQSVAVPGMLPALATAHERWGRMEWADCVRPVAGLAESGAVVTADLTAVLRKYRKTLEQDPEFLRVFFPDGRVPVMGGRLPRPDLARTLAAIASDGADVMRSGKVAEAFATSSKKGGGWVAESDLAAVQSEVAEPPQHTVAWLESSYQPRTGDWRGNGFPGSASTGKGRTRGLGCAAMHRVCEVLKRVYPRVRAVVGDGAGSHGALKSLLDGKEGREIAQAVAAGSPDLTEEEESDEIGEGSTSHFVVMDSEGNVVSATQSLGFKFGAGVIIPGTGVILNNSMANFAVRNENSRNYLRQGLRARTTMSPVIADGSRWAGAWHWVRREAHGYRQRCYRSSPGSVAADSTLAEATEAPRFHLRPWQRRSDPRNLVDVEDGFTGADELRQRGWVVDFHPADEHLFGGVNAAWRDMNGKMDGVADSRRHNYAKGQPDDQIEDRQDETN